MSIERTPDFQQKIVQPMNQQIKEFHPGVANQAYSEHKKKEDLKKRNDEVQKQIEQVEKIKGHHTVNKVNKGEMDGVVERVRESRRGEVDEVT
jgi:hypothetical protein